MKVAVSGQVVGIANLGQTKPINLVRDTNADPQAHVGLKTHYIFFVKI